MRAFAIIAAVFVLASCAEPKAELMVEVQSTELLDSLEYVSSPIPSLTYTKALEFQICELIGYGAPCTSEDIAGFVERLRPLNKEFAKIFCERYDGSEQKVKDLALILVLSSWIHWDDLRLNEVRYAYIPPDMVEGAKKCLDS